MSQLRGKYNLDIETNLQEWLDSRVLALIAILDGSQALLFHVEQWDKRRWLFRCRWPESDNESLQVWQRERGSEENSLNVPLLDTGSSIEVQWRFIEDEGWQDAVPHVLGLATAEFSVRVKQPRDFSEDPIVRASALVRGMPSCFDLSMPTEVILLEDLPVCLTVEGVAYVPLPGCILGEGGEFCCSNDAFDIANIGGSQGALLPIDGPAMAGTLPHRGTFFVKQGRLSDDEISKLLEVTRG